VSERILFVAPHPCSTGEAATAVACTERLRAVGHDVSFLASPFVADRLPASIAVERFTDNIDTNTALWHLTVAAVRPTIVWFADYEMNFFRNTALGTIGNAAWTTCLDALDARLITFDHFGLTTFNSRVAYGRWPRATYEAIPPLPARMERLLPCPINAPSRANAFQYWTPCAATDDDVVELREQLAPEGFLVAYFVPAWAERLARAAELPDYDLLSAWLQTAFASIGEPVTVVAITESPVLSPSTTPGVTLMNICAPNYVFCERLLRATDLVLSDNAISSMVGKAVCVGVPSLLTRLDEYWVYPLWDDDTIDQFGVFHENPYGAALSVANVGTVDGAELVQSLLRDVATIEEQRQRQESYAADVAQLPWIEELV
jgi:hypothetical protein